MIFHNGFDCSFDQINVALVSIFQKHWKILRQYDSIILRTSNVWTSVHVSVYIFIYA